MGGTSPPAHMVSKYHSLNKVNEYTGKIMPLHKIVLHTDVLGTDAYFFTHETTSLKISS